MPRRLRAAAALVPAAFLAGLGLAVFPVARLAAGARVLPSRVRSGARMVAVLAMYAVCFEVSALLGVVRERGARHAETATCEGAVHPAARCLRCADLYGRLLKGFFGPGFATAGMRVVRDPERQEVPRGRPVVIVLRHAGFLNAQLVNHIVTEDLGRTPRMLAKSLVWLDPGHGALLEHLPAALFRFDRPGRRRVREALRHLARSARPADAIIIAPEGTNFTVRRRAEAITRLLEHGHVDAATDGEALRHTMPPHAAGLRVLLETAPGLDVVFVAHTGMEALVSWATRFGYEPPRHGAVYVTWWHVPAEEVPRGREEMALWLRRWWAGVDRWVAARCGDGVAAPVPADPATLMGALTEPPPVEDAARLSRIHKRETDRDPAVDRFGERKVS
ncbi:1-acyl-sn-glycerol-3-phosphate acyltransferase [Streptomyces laurentii]|uniref:1-acyl-sn-glycerol-3-phosphate acyltransferase n=1 Tax=Streptomyces laurentii TaxID=39478 RepID=UPI003689242D